MANQKRTHAQEAATKLATEGLPAAVDIERMVLGAILITAGAFELVSAALVVKDFSLQVHQTIFSRMADVASRGEPVDRITLCSELGKHPGELQAIGGLSYISDLDQGLPDTIALEAYLAILKQKSGLRRIIFSARDLANQALLAQDDPATLIESATTRLQEIAQDSRTQESDGGQTVEEVVSTYEGGIQAFLDPSTRRLGLPTGIERFDSMVGGLGGGELIIIAARPSMGKTAWAMNIVEHLCLSKHKYAAVFSLEMSSESLITRMICSIAMVDQMKFRLGFLNRDERSQIQNALYQLTQCRLKIFDKTDITVKEICRITKKLVQDEGCHIMFLDYLQLCGSSGKAENRNLEVGQMTRDLKLLAKECDIPVVLLSQLSRAPEKRGGTLRPMLSDIRDSGSAEADADKVIFLFRQYLYQRDRPDLRTQAEIIVAKSRNSPIGVIPARFLPEYTKFANKEAEQDDDTSATDAPPDKPRRKKESRGHD
jgi:replicative DNA helicase